MDAGAADLCDIAAQVMQAREIEFAVGIERAAAPGDFRPHDPVATDDMQRLLVAYDEMLAIAIVFVDVELAVSGAGGRAQFLEEHLVTQPLCILDFTRVAGNRHRITIISCRRDGFRLQLQHIGSRLSHGLRFMPERISSRHVTQVAGA